MKFYTNKFQAKCTVSDHWVICCGIAPRWMPLDLIDKSTLVQVMAWCRQATSHYLSQCWPRSMSPNGVTRPQLVKMSFREISYIDAFVQDCSNSSVLAMELLQSCALCQDILQQSLEKQCPASAWWFEIYHLERIHLFPIVSPSIV